MKFNLKLGSVMAALVLLATPAFAGSHAKSNTIVDVASNTEEFSTLVTALRAADLVQTLNGQGPLTVSCSIWR